MHLEGALSWEFQCAVKVCLMLKHSGPRCLSGTVSLVPECVIFISDQSFLGVLMHSYISPFPSPVLLWQHSTGTSVCLCCQIVTQFVNLKKQSLISIHVPQIYLYFLALNSLAFSSARFVTGLGSNIVGGTVNAGYLVHLVTVSTWFPLVQSCHDADTNTQVHLEG